MSVGNETFAMLYTLLTILFFGISSSDIDEDLCISANEKALFERINNIRKQNGLTEVKLSRSLTKVAKMHASDLQINEPFDERLCNPHSWSDQGIWKACCYKNDHSNAECMWKKPSEITDYKGDGYEIVAFWMSGENPTEEISHETAMRMWLDSPGHSNVILNKSSFANVEWNAVGVAIFGNYASVWFGMEKDDASPPQDCSN